MTEQIDDGAAGPALVDPPARCDLCGGPRFQVFDTRAFKGGTITNWICERCGLVTLWPRMDEEALERFYRDEYRVLYQGQAGPTERDLQIQTARARHLAAYARTCLPTCRLHLDIGASAGLLMRAMRDTYGCRTVGVELGEAYRARCIEASLEVYESLEAARTHVSDRFDLVSMSHVLEHLPHPVDYLRRLRTETLTPDGWLLVEIPNLYAHECFEVAHAFSFSPATLSHVLRAAGFQVRRSLRHSIPLATSGRLYVTVMAQVSAGLPRHGSVAPRTCVRYVRIRRAAGLSRISVLQYMLARVRDRIGALSRKCLGIGRKAGS